MNKKLSLRKMAAKGRRPLSPPAPAPARRAQGHLATLSLPNEQGIRRIVRYEAALERQLHRSIRELKRLPEFGLADAAQRAVDPLGGPPKLPNKATQVLLNE